MEENFRDSIGTINEEGKITEIRGDQTLNKKDSYENMYMEALRKLDHWKPARYQGKPVQTEVFIKILNVKHYVN